MPTARRSVDARAPRLCVEPLERRTLFTISVQVDYTYDTNNFFDSPDKRAILQTALTAAVSRYNDQLSAIVPSAGNTWKAVLDNPGTGGTAEVQNLTIPFNTVLVYVGGRNMDSLGIGGPGGFSSSGSTAWNDLVASRGQTNTRGSGARDFGPFGGSIAFDSQPTGGWYFGTDPDSIAGRNDFYSVALHEMTHLLGFGTSDAWQSRVSGGLFTGPASVGEYDGSGNVPLSSDRAHWASGTSDDGKEAAMDPDLTTGTRKTLTALDLAGMDDLGWEIPLSASLGSVNSVTTSGATSTTFSVTYSHYTDIDVTTLGAGDLTVSGPNGFSTGATLVSATPAGKSVTATYSIAAPGGTFDGSDTGSYTVSMIGAAVGDGFGNFAPAGSLGSFTVDINSPPAASFSAQDVVQIGGAEHTIKIVYSDSGGIDGSSLDTADVAVTRQSDGLALAVIGISDNGTGNASPRTVTYTLAAPGGSWDASDNGTYAVALVAGQVRDAAGTAADAGTLGTFEVSVGAVTFAAGRNAVFVDASGDTVTVSLKGPGTGQVLFDDPGNADPSGLVLNDVTGATTLTITSTGAGTSLGGLTVNGSLKSVAAKNTDFAGAMSVSGTLPKVLFRNASGTMAFASAGAPVSFTFASIRDLSITSAADIKSLKATDWLDTDGTADLIAAPTLMALTIKGALQAGISAGTIGKISAGAVDGAEIRASSTIGTVVAASLANSLIFAGVRADVSTLPDGLDDFENASGTIKSVTLKGKSAPFSNTRIAAPGVGKVVLGVATAGDPANPSGVAADRITSATGTATNGTPFKLSKLDDSASSLDAGDFVVRVL